MDKRPESLFRSFQGWRALDPINPAQYGDTNRYFGVLPFPATVVGPPPCSLIGTYTVTFRRIVHTHLARHPITHRTQLPVLQEGVTASSCPRNSSAIST